MSDKKAPSFTIPVRRGEKRIPPSREVDDRIAAVLAENNKVMEDIDPARTEAVE